MNEVYLGNGSNPVHIFRHRACCLRRDELFSIQILEMTYSNGYQWAGVGGISSQRSADTAAVRFSVLLPIFLSLAALFILIQGSV